MCPHGSAFSEETHSGRLTMKIFTSWSGDRSRAVAEALKVWLPSVCQKLQPWMSLEDISKGARWNPDVANQLEESRIGIICLTRENVSAPWILFEAGALAKGSDEALVCTYLLDLAPGELTDPLAQFQATVADKDDTLKLLKTLNKALKNEGFSDEEIAKAFEKRWPELERDLNRIPEDKFRGIFGQDAFLGRDFHLVQTSFAPKIRLMDPQGNIYDLVNCGGTLLRPAYAKLRSRRESNAKPVTFKLKNPVGGAGARALRYIAPFVQAQSKGLVSISSDYDLDKKVDISFISFGGPLANYKTEDVLNNENNDLVRFVEGGDPFCPDSRYGFFDAKSEHKIVKCEPGLDYGLILKLNPKERPKRTWIVCAGYGGWGTSGAAWYLARYWERIYRYAEEKPFAIIVSVRERDESAHAIWPPGYTDDKASE